MLARKMIVVMIMVVLVFMVSYADAKVRDVKAIGEEALRKGVISAPTKDRDFTKIPPGTSYRPGELLVRFVPREIDGKLSGMRVAEKKRILDSLGGAIEKHSFDIVPGLSLVKLPAGMTVEEALKKFNTASGILYAEPDYEVKICSTFPNDSMFNDLWGMHNTGQTGGKADADIDAPEAWDISTGSRDIIVAVIDTGVDYTHPDLKANMWINPGEDHPPLGVVGPEDFDGVDDDHKGYVDDIYGYDFCNNDGDPMDDYFHGTHCAGTIGAVGNNNGEGVVGVCWKVKIMAVKFLGSDGRGSTSGAIASVEYSVLMGANLSSNSWGGGGYNQGLKDAIDAAGEAGMLFVAAAGNYPQTSPQDNDAPGGPYFFPSSYNSDNIIAVMSTDKYDNMSSFSHYGKISVDLGAPGSNILSTFPTYMTDAMASRGFSTYYETISGTSMATPHVAGACALFWSMIPAMSNSQVKHFILDTVDELDALDGRCASNGRLNVYNLLEAASGDIILEQDYYNCDCNVGISLFDAQLIGQCTQDVNITCGGDLEIVTLTETTATAGVFTGTILTDSGAPNTGDGILQVSHGQTITVTYENADDGTGNPAEPNDTATVDCVSPTISNVSFPEENVGPDQLVTFSTNELTTARIICGTSCGEANVVAEGPNPRLDHSIVIRGLESLTKYYFTIEATDLAGNTAVDSNSGNCYQFVTCDINHRVHNVTQDKWYVRIQDAINKASGGDDIVAYPGTYCESVNFGGKGVTVRSTDPCDWDVVEATVVYGDGADCAFIKGGSLSGLTITGAKLGILSVPKVSNCIIRDNISAGVVAYASSSTVTNCIVKDNGSQGIYVDYGGVTVKNSVIYGNVDGVMFEYGGGTVSNCTIANNSSRGVVAQLGSCGISNSIIWDNGDDLSGSCYPTYCCISDCNDASGTGNICGPANNPCFVDYANDDYHIRLVSPCINAGNPSGNYNGQTDIDGGPRVQSTYVDIGADEVNLVVADAHQWGLDEKSGTIAKDSVGDANGSFNGDDPCWVRGLIGGAIDCNGVKDYFSVSSLNGAYRSASTFTVAGWFNTSQSTGMQTIVGQWSNYKPSPYAPTLYFGWQVLVENNKVVARFGQSNPYPSDITGTSNVVDPNWHHFAIVYPTSSSNAVLYVDGQSQGTPAAKSFSLYTMRFRIGDGSYAPNGGGTPDLKGGPFNGIIDELMIFNRALSAEDVEQLYEEGAEY